MKRDTSIPYVNLIIEMHGCVENLDSFTSKLKKFLVNELDPDYDSDIEIVLNQSAGL